MKILENVVEKMDDTLDEIEFYAEQAFLLRNEHKALSDTFIKVASMHLDIYKMLHDRVVEIIEEEKRKGTPPPEMLAIWNYQHGRLVKRLTEARFLVEDYNKSY